MISMAIQNLVRRTLYIILCVLVLPSCKMKPEDSTYNSWNSGKITLATDENLNDIMQQLVQIYEHDNEQASIQLDYQPQDKIIHSFVNGGVRSMVISKKLSKEEIAVSEQNQQVQVAETVFAYTAVAMIAHKDFKDSVVDISFLKNYLQPGSPVKLIFDNKQSGIPAVIIEKTAMDAALFRNALVVKNAEEVIEYVHRNSQAIGFISFNLVSDPNDSHSKKILSAVKLLGVRQNNMVYYISQESIYNFSYPLQHPVSIVLGNNPELVGKGFSNFLCREKASKILLKAGLVPRFMPVRSIIVHNELQIN